MDALMSRILEMDSATIISFLDYVVIGILALCVLSGFIKGMFRSVYNLIIFVGLMLLGWFLMPAIVNFALDYNVSSFNLNISGVGITTIRESLPAIIGSFDETLGTLMVEGTETYTLLFSLVFSAFRLIMMIIWLLLTITIFKFVFWIIYLIIRPRTKDAQGNKKRITFVSRLGGGVIGLAYGLVITIMLAIPFAGLTSIGGSIGELANSQTTTVSYRFAKATNQEYLYLDGETADPYSEYAEVFAFMQQFRGDSLMGQIGGIGVGKDTTGEKTTIDEALFDQLLEFKYGDVKVEVRQELKNIASAYVEIFNATGGNINFSTISELDQETLDSVLGKISNLQILNAAAPVAVEYLGNNPKISESLTEMGMTKDDISNLITEVKQINFAEEISTIASAVIDLGKSGLFDQNEDGENKSIMDTLLNADSSMLTSAMDKLGELGISDMVGEFGVSTLLNGAAFGQILDQFGISKEDINLEGIDWGEELANLGGVITALQDMGLIINEDGSIDFTNLSQDGISTFVDELFKSNVLGNNTKLIVATIKQVLPEEVQDFVQIDDLTSEDLKSVLSVGSTVMSYMDKETGQIDFEEMLKSEDAQKLGDAISNSDAMAKTIQDMIGKVLTSVGVGIDFDDFNIDGINWGNEIVALGNIMNELDKFALKFGSESTNFSFDDYSETMVNGMVDTLFTSQILSKNTKVLMQAIKDMVPAAYKDRVEVKEMTAAEVKSLLSSLRSELTA